jgi:uncharacterized protein YkwD
LHAPLVRVAPLARAAPLLFAALLVLVVVLSSTAGAARLRSRTAAVRLQRDLLHDLNAIRAQHGLAPLRLSAGLAAAARQHASEMLRRGYFSHSSANGLPYWKRIRSFYPELAGANWTVGENLYWIPGEVGAAQVVRRWMHSPEHRENILMPAWRQIGIAVESRRDAPGVFDDLSVTVFATDFGARN